MGSVRRPAPETERAVSIKIELRAVDGEPAGTFATNLSDWVIGMEFRGGENQLMRIVEICEAGDVWQVEPVEERQVPMSH